MAGIRSKAYPSISLEAGVMRADTIRKSVGKGFFDRETMAKNMGYKSLSGVATRAIAALVHYGLLERQKDKYSLSDLAMRLVLPVNEEDRKDAALTALREPDLYKELINTYSGTGESLPEALGNVLAHNHGINPNSSNDAARVFIESIDYAGIYENGKITMIKEEPDNSDIQDVSNTTIRSTLQSENQTQKAVDSTVRRLPSGIEIGFPSKLDYAVMIGEFADSIKSLEDKAQMLLSENNLDETQ